MGKITCKGISNQDQNHLIQKWFEIKIKIIFT